MKTSIDRILTTHVGSLPRPPAVADLLIRKDAESDYDVQEFDKVIREGVAAAVARQVAAGVDVVSDGETSKVGYSTYVKDRLTGFGGDHTPKPNLDTAPYPEFRKRMVAFMGAQSFRRTCCIGPVELKDLSAVQTDIGNFKAALASAPGAVEGFLNAASPGVVASFQPNQYYPTHEAYIEAVTAALTPEYEAIANAGLVLQIDCPDLAMSRHTGFQDLTEDEFLRRAGLHVEALNQALANIPRSQVRVHICWGNYEGPHDHDIPLEKVLPLIRQLKAQAFAFEHANPRHEHEWAVWRDAKLPDDAILIPGILDSSTNYVEHPELVAQRIERFAGFVGRDRVVAGTDCGFGTFVRYSKVDPEITYKKLQALHDGAAIATKRLWGH